MSIRSLSARGQLSSVASVSSNSVSSLSIFQCAKCLQDTKGLEITPLILAFSCNTCQVGWYGCRLCSGHQGCRSRFHAKRNYLRHLEENGRHQQLLHALRLVMARKKAEMEKPPEQKRIEAETKLIRHESYQLAFQCFPQVGPYGDFFRYQIVNGQCGAYSLAIRSNFNHFDNARDELCQNEVLMDFRMSWFHRQIPRTLSSLLADIIQDVYQLGKLHQLQDTSAGHKPDHRRIVPPDDFNEVNTRYLRGVRSIYRSLPTAEVHKLGEDHAYSNILDCAKIALANGLELASISTSMTKDSLGALYRYPWETPRAAEIAHYARTANLPGDTKIMFYILWRDDVEPNWTKSNRGSVWLFTVSFLGTGKFSNSKYCTFPLAIGKSKASHHEVEHLVHNVMTPQAAMSHRLYSGASKSVESVAFFPLLISADSPEKRKGTGTATGGATYHIRFGCSADHYRLLDVIRPCNGCLLLMRLGQLPDSCKECANWDVFKVDETVREKLKLEPKNQYPVSFLENEYGIKYLTDDGMLLPFMLTYSRLKASYRLAYENFAARRWTSKETEEFLNVECISGKLSQMVIEHGTNARIIAGIQEGTSALEEEMQAIFLADAEIDPDAYLCPPSPAIWKSELGDISINPDVPMHLIFLGVLKSTLFVVKKWMQKNQLLDDFLEHCKVMYGLVSDVHLDWLRIEEFREGKFGGWVAENFKSFSMIMLWFFQDIGLLLRKEVLGDDSIPPSHSPNTNWRKKHYVRWFYDRGVEYNGTIKEMKAKILHLMGTPGGPPPVIDRSGEYSPEQIERVLVALEAMITVLMTDEVYPEVTCPLAELRIKQFLTEFDILNQSLLDETSKPKVITASNYLTLLNLPNIMRRFGSLRKFWEGNFCGEGFVRVCKPHLRFGQRLNFAYNAMDHCHRESSLEIAILGLRSELDKGSPSFVDNEWARLLQAARASFSINTSRADTAQSLFGQKVVSTIVFLGPKSQDGSRDVHVYAATKCHLSNSNPVKFQLYSLEKNLDKISTKLTMRYYKWQLAAAPTVWGDLLMAHPPPVFECTFGCLLPMMCYTGESVHMLVCEDRSVYA